MTFTPNRELPPVAVLPQHWNPDFRVRKRNGRTVVHATCPDGVRRQVNPYVSFGHIGVSRRAPETQNAIISYPIEDVMGTEGRFVMRTLMRMIASGEIGIASDVRQWADETAVVRDAIRFVMERRGGYAFDVTRSSEYRKFIGRPTRRDQVVTSIAEFQGEEFPLDQRSASAY